MNLNDLKQRLDAQIKKDAELAEKKRERRQVQQSVTVDRRLDQRRAADRNAAPQRENYSTREAYDRAYDRWSERQSR